MQNKNFTYKCRACGKNRHYKLFVNDLGHKLNNCCNACFNKKVKLHIKHKKVDPTKIHINCGRCGEPKRLCDMYFKYWEKNGKGCTSFIGFIKSKCKDCKTELNTMYKDVDRDAYNKKQNYPKQHRRRRGKMSYAYLKLQEMAKRDGVKCLITKDQFEALFQKPYDYYDGKKITFGKKAYRLDRIGLPQFGGDGKRGGDYHIDNVVIAHVSHNFRRDKMDLTVADYKKLYRGYMAFKASGKRNPDYLRFKRLKKRLKTKKSI